MPVMSRRMVVLSAAAGIGTVAVATLALTRRPRQNVLRPSGGAEVLVMDFAKPFPLDPPPDGWRHYKFWTRSPMHMSFAVKEGVPALRLETHGSASMLFRHVEIPLQRYPLLSWRWYVEKPINSALDERSRAGDDHPARLFITFRTAAAESRSMEVIWGNKLRAGDYKFIGSFPHYVARGGDENIGRWWREEIDLAAIYRRLWPDNHPADVVEIALFCDSDETGGETVSYFADVRLRRNGS